MMAARRLGQLVPRSSVMFLCDMQEKFRHNVAFFPQIVNVAARMLQATVLDLMEKDIDVHVVADACSSRSQVDRMFTFERLRQSGAFITTSEAVMFQLLKDAKHPHFREVQKLILDKPTTDSGLLAMFGQKTA
uniref:isochorismatase domain-containing protein 2 isoform X2 n=1 Tax=Myxine glutinosa TaxID=7769 RepID=UPI00358F86E9